MPATPTTSPALWRNVSFVLLWTSVAASGFGDRLIQLASWALLGMSEPGAQASSIQAAVYFFFFLPYLVFGPLGGWLADTLPRKWIMLACDEGRGLILLWAMLLVPAGAAVTLGPEHHWKVYSLVGLVGVLAAIFSPTRNATIPQIVPLHQLQAANALVLGIAVIASMIGLIIGSRIIERYSVRAGLFTGVLLFTISGTFFAFLKLRSQVRQAIGKRPSQFQRLVQGAAYLREHRPVLQLVLLNVVFWAAANVLLAAIAALCKTHYGIPDEQLKSHIADMGGVLGFGMLLSAVWVAWQNTRRESAWLAMLALLASAGCMLALAFNRSYHAGLVLAFFTGFFGNTAMICVATLTQSLTPDYIRGRVFGVRELMSTFFVVLVNFAIWQTPAADDWMVPILVGVAGLLATISLLGLIAQMTRTPTADRLLNMLWHISRAYVLVWHRARWVGKHHLPAGGPVILAANHTTGLDPFLIQAVVPRPVRWVMLRRYQFRLLTPIWRRIEPIALDLDASDTSKLRQIIHALKAGHPVGIFPEGALQRDQRALQPFEPGIGLIARRTGACIVPIWIHGTPRTRAMLWHFLKPSRSTVIFGRPYQPDPAYNHEQIADDLRKRMLKLARPIEATEQPSRLL